MSLFIRTACHEDADGMIKAHRISIREVCAKDYTVEQIDAWSGRDFKAKIWHQYMDKDAVSVVADEAVNIFGFCHHGTADEIQNKYELKGLYLTPDALGMGFGSKMVSDAISLAKKQGHDELFLYSTKTAVEFY